MPLLADDGELFYYPCPCCGYFVFRNPPGSYDICPICFWEDDLSQLRFPRMTGANRVSLIQGQENFARFGVCEHRLAKHVRTPDTGDVRERNWRPIDPTQDNIEEISGREDGFDYPLDRTTLYYWREDYWKRQPHQ